MSTDFSGYIKYNIGDMVWFAKAHTEYLNCPVCDGTGEIEPEVAAKAKVKDTTWIIPHMKCPVCKGFDWNNCWNREGKVFRRVPYDKYECVYGRVCGIYAEIDEHEATEIVDYNIEVSLGGSYYVESASALETFDNESDCIECCAEKTAENIYQAKKYVYQEYVSVSDDADTEIQLDSIKKLPIEELFILFAGKTYEEVCAMPEKELIDFIYGHLECECCPLRRKCEEPPYKELDSCYETLKLWFKNKLNTKENKE